MDEPRDEQAPVETRPKAQIDAAWDVLSAASRDRADAYLEEQMVVARAQAEVLRLQAHEMKGELRLRHWSLRMRHTRDVMKVTFEIALAFVMLAVAGLVALAIWKAAHDDGLVIEAFNVPSDMSAKGLTGQVIATQIQDRIAFIQSHVDTLRAAGTFRNNWGDDIKVRIPDTGVSVGEAYRFLAGWLGHETHISGEMWHDRDGIALAARAGNASARIFRAGDSDLDSLISKAAEHVFWQTQPYRYVVFLAQQGRRAESLAHTRALALYGPKEDRAWAYARWGDALFVEGGDFKGELAKDKIAAMFDPTLPLLFANMAGDEFGLGHDERALHDIERAVRLLKTGGSRQYAEADAASSLLTQRVILAEQGGDFAGGIALASESLQLADYSSSHASLPIMASEDFARDHDVTASRKSDPEAPNGEATEFRMIDNGSYAWQVPPLPQAMRAAAVDDWRGVRDDLRADLALPAAQGSLAKAFFPTAFWPWLAYAYSRLGDERAAHALINRTPLDCYLCVRMRARIDAAEKNWGGADHWFDDAAQQAPSIPFAYTDWGAMLLAKGDNEDAIAKFETAHQKGPHFADPLEMWGEALMAKNRSDLALTKFEEANKYAPNWGRLHLKWGEALFYTGKRDEAQDQFAAAARLDLSSTDATELSRVKDSHG